MENFGQRRKGVYDVEIFVKIRVLGQKMGIWDKRNKQLGQKIKYFGWERKYFGWEMKYLGWKMKLTISI